ncbi:MAG TPA: hypothetical protein VGR89_11725, partial [Puia sp.]|nr:hypothetical protein [Puia sp.]
MVLEFPSTIRYTGGQALHYTPLAFTSALSGLRTKEVTSRPLRETSEGTKAFIKYFNFLVPILLAIAYGIYRSRRNRLIREERMNE